MYKNPLRRRKTREKVTVPISDTIAEYTEEVSPTRKKRGIIISGFRAWRKIERSKKMNVVASKTTQNVAVGTLAGGSAVIGALAFLRSFAPGIVFWPEDSDTAVAIAVATIVVPGFSRLIAFWRNPEKKEGAK